MSEYADLVKRLRRDGIAARDTLKCAELAPTVDPEDALEAADAIEALYTRLVELEASFDYIEATVEKRFRSSEATEILGIIRKERVFYDCV